MGDELMDVVNQICISKCKKFTQTLNGLFYGSALAIFAPPKRQKTIDLYAETSNLIAHNLQT